MATENKGGNPPGLPSGDVEAPKGTTMTAKHRRLPTIHRGRRVLAGVAAAALLTVGIASAPAFAAKGGGSGKPTGGSTSGSSLTLATPLVNDLNGDGLPNWGDTVTFNVSTTATTAPYVDLTCSQSGTLVYSATSGFFDGYLWPWTKDMTLSSQSWTGGGADCTATLYYYGSRGKRVVLSTLAFRANA